MTGVEILAERVASASFDELSAQARERLKAHILDALACALGALGGEPVRLVREHIIELGGTPTCTLIGGGRSAPDRAAFLNGALVRYLDFNDSYLAPGETCHPSDNLGAVLAAVEHKGGSGRDLMLALAVAYQVQCRLSDVAPVRAHGFDHTTQGAYAAAAGIARALGLDAQRTANAIAISGTANNALRVTRTGKLSNWKGLAYPNTAYCATWAALLAGRGITGPLEVFEGNKGFMDAIAGPFEIDWRHEDLERVTRASLKRYNAEMHSQSAVEAVLALRHEHRLTGAEVKSIEVDVFRVAYDIIGGGAEGSKKEIRTKEEADHSLPYILAVALLDGQVLPPQYAPERITRPDVQSLLRRVEVRPDEALDRRFPKELPCRVTITLADGRTLRREQSDFVGYHTSPMPFEQVAQKLEHLAAGRADAGLKRAIIGAVAELEEIPISRLTERLAQASIPG